MFWNRHEVSFSEDLDSYSKLPPAQQKFIASLLSFFAQSDTDIGGMYVNHYLPVFAGHPEVRMMLLAFASMESTHADAYEAVTATLGITDYEAFLRYPEMKSKHDYLSTIEGTRDIGKLLRTVAITSGFGEGLQLYGSFTMLLSFVDRGFMAGMGHVVQYSMRDESAHVEGLIGIFNALKSEFPEHWTDETKRDIYQAARDMVSLEIDFVSMLFDYLGQEGLPNLTKTQVEEYIKYLADRRLVQLGLKPNYFIKENPIPWLPKYFMVAHEDLFSTPGTEYNRSSGKQDWDSLL